MADRGLLARSHLPAFREYLKKRGWVEQKTKGTYEVARFTHAEHIPLILYARLGAEVHLTIQDKDWALVRRFLRSVHDPYGSDDDVKVIREGRRRAKNQ